LAFILDAVLLVDVLGTSSSGQHRRWDAAAISIAAALAVLATFASVHCVMSWRPEPQAAGAAGAAKTPGSRDLAWDAIVTVADRLSRQHESESISVKGARRRSLVGWSVTEGLETVDNWTDVFEPVRQRRLLGRTWTECQPVQQAASKIGTFLRERPDLRPR
jgi:hypothetical protein